MYGHWSYSLSVGDSMQYSGILNNGTERSVKLQCLPLFSVLLAIGNPTVSVHYLRKVTAIDI